MIRLHRSATSLCRVTTLPLEIVTWRRCMPKWMQEDRFILNNFRRRMFKCIQTRKTSGSYNVGDLIGETGSFLSPWI